LAAVLQATIPIFGMFFAYVMLPDEPLQLPKLLGVLLALSGVTLICGRLLGFNSPLAFWDGVAVVVGPASAAYANVLVKARSLPACARHARGVVVDFDQIYIAPIKPAIEQRRLEALRGDEEL
jgi:drug/metabolite transporter (DMT)-like permease